MCRIQLGLFLPTAKTALTEARRRCADDPVRDRPNVDADAHVQVETRALAEVAEDVLHGTG